MSQVTYKNKHIPAQILAIACSVVLISFLWQGAIGFNLGDEGFLWYGVQRVLLGEVPIRDYQAYDPGRYYWSAALLHLAGNNGIMYLRAAVAIFQGLGLFMGLLLIAQSGQHGARGRVLFWLLSAAILWVWMFPRHKLFDISLAILLLGTLTYLIRNPLPKRYFVAGLGVGLAALFGRNHGMYGAVASMGVLVWLNIKRRSGPALLQAFLLWAAGVVAGFLPILCMALLVPGFAAAFWDSVRFLFEQKATNLPLPVPWPWTVNFAASSAAEAARGVLIGLFFIGLLCFALVSLAWVLYRKAKEMAVPPAFVAASFLALPYAHFAYSRADVGHLAQGIFPLLLGCLVILSTARARAKWPLALILCGASFWTMLASHPGWQCRASQPCVKVEISGNTLVLDPGTANDVALLRQLDRQYAGNGKPFIAAPFWPGAYALLERKSPLWEIYPIQPRQAGFEKTEIGRTAAAQPGFVFIIDIPLDGREELRFRKTHPLIHEYIVRNYVPVPFAGNPAYQIFKSKSTE